MNKDFLEVGFYFDALDLSPCSSKKEIVNTILDLEVRYRNEPEIIALLIKAKKYLTADREKYEEEILPCLDYIRLLLRKRYSEELEKAVIKYKLLNLEEIEEKIERKIGTLKDILGVELRQNELKDIRDKLLQEILKDICDKLLQEKVDLLNTFKGLKKLKPKIDTYIRDVLNFLSGILHRRSYTEIEESIREIPFFIVVRKLYDLLQKLINDIEQREKKIRTTTRKEVEKEISKLIRDIGRLIAIYDATDFNFKIEALKILSRLGYPYDELMPLDNLQLLSILINAKKLLLSEKEKIIEKNVELRIAELKEKKRKLEKLLDTGKKLANSINKLNLQTGALEYVKLVNELSFEEPKFQPIQPILIPPSNWEEEVKDYIKEVKSEIPTLAVDESDVFDSLYEIISSLKNLKMNIQNEIEQKGTSIIEQADEELSSICSKINETISKIDNLLQELSQLKASRFLGGLLGFLFGKNKKVSIIKGKTLDIVKQFSEDSYQHLKEVFENLSEREVISIIDAELRKLKSKLEAELDEINRLKSLRAKEKKVANLIDKGERLLDESCLHKKLDGMRGDAVWITLNQKVKQKLASGDLNGNICVFDLSTTGTEPVMTANHGAVVNSLVIIPDYNLLASAGQDGNIVLFDLNSGERVKSVQASEKEGGLHILTTQNEKSLISGGADGVIRLWKLPQLEIEYELRGHEREITCLSLTADGKKLVSSDISTVIIWDLKERKIIKKLKGHIGLITCLAISSDNRILAVGEASPASKIILWDLEKCRMIDVLEGHQESVEWLMFGKDGTILISRDGIGNTDDSKFSDIIIWNLSTGRPLAKIRGHRGFKNCSIDFVVDDDEKYLIGGGSNGILIWDFLKIKEKAAF